MTESDVQAAICDYLKTRDIWHFRCSVGRKGGYRYGGPPGTPDIIGMYQGKFLGIECKGPDGKLSEEQVVVGQSIRRHGGVYIIAREVEDVVNALT